VQYSSPYLRIQKNKFWTWVAVSFAIGLIIGFGVMYLRQVALNKQVNAAKTQAATQVQQSSAALSETKARLASTEASLVTMTQKYDNLAAENAATAAANKEATPSSSTTITVVSRTITPSTVASDGTIAMTVKVKGQADKVTMRLTSSSLGFDQTYALKKTTTSGSTETWRLSTSAPKKKGAYKYFGTAYLDSKGVTMPGASPSTLTVK
jgi:uncharacterized membrane-anchored protein YhcB (DUF1043 family)